MSQPYREDTRIIQILQQILKNSKAYFANTLLHKESKDNYEMYKIHNIVLLTKTSM